VIQLWLNGPLEFHGDLDIEGSTVSIQNETRVTLCRCGASNNKPFCDNSHREIDFQAEDTGIKIAAPTQARDGKVSISAEPNGPLRVAGNLEIMNADGQVIFYGGEVSLCRCGRSSNKPFCDGTHNKIAFEGE
jgi:CDGSH-type Zn-finger protein